MRTSAIVRQQIFRMSSHTFDATSASCQHLTHFIRTFLVDSGAANQMLIQYCSATNTTFNICTAISTHSVSYVNNPQSNCIKFPIPNSPTSFRNSLAPLYCSMSLVTFQPQFVWQATRDYAFILSSLNGEFTQSLNASLPKRLLTTRGETPSACHWPGLITVRPLETGN